MDGSDSAPAAGSRSSWHRATLVLAALAISLALGSLYWYGGQQNSRLVNTDPSQRDQNANIGQAEDLLNEEYSHIAGRNRMPLYPFVLSFGLDPTQIREVAFGRAKDLTILLSMVLLIFVGILGFRYFPPLEAAVLLLIVSFMLYVFKASYVQPELLYYTLTAFLFVSMARFFVRPAAAIAVAIGVLAGLAHLTKASVLPSLAIFMLTGIGWGAARVMAASQEPNRGGGRSFALGFAMKLTLVLGFFLLTVFPYVKNSWYRFGRPFYNVNSTFYVWYDTWSQAEAGTKAYGDRLGWPDMPAEELPSLGRYLREHTPTEVLGRFVRGASLTVSEAAGSYGYAKYVVILTGVFALAWSLSWRRMRDLALAYPQVIVFVAAYFVVQTLLYAWYAQMAGGNRLALALLLPLLLSFAYGIRLGLRGRRLVLFGRTIDVLTVLYLMLLAVILLDMRAVYTDRILRIFGGS